jgi:hypothetical protein
MEPNRRAEALRSPKALVATLFVSRLLLPPLFVQRLKALFNRIGAARVRYKA